MSTSVNPVLNAIGKLVSDRQAQVISIAGKEEPSQQAALNGLNLETFEEAGKLLKTSDELADFYPVWQAYEARLLKTDPKDLAGREWIFEISFVWLQGALNGFLPFAAGNMVAEHPQARDAFSGSVSGNGELPANGQVDEDYRSILKLMH